MASFIGKNARVRLAGRNPLALVLAANEAFEDEGSTPARTRYRITDKSKQILDPNATVGSALVVERDPDGISGFSTVPATDYTLEYPGARIVFASQNGVGAVVRTQNGAYLPYISGAMGFREWSLDIEREQLDATEFGDDLWREFKQGIATGSGTLSGFWVADEMLQQMNDTLPETTALSLELKSTPGAPTTPNPRLEFFAVFSGHSVGVALDELIGLDLDFVVDGPVYLRTDAPE